MKSGLVPMLSKSIERLPKDYLVKIYEKIRSLKEDPRPSGCIKLRGYSKYWRIRIGPYRVIYSIEDEIKIVEVRKIIHRKDAY